jgi:hypothetical protein
MRRFVRIAIAVVLASAGLAGAHVALGLGPQLFERGIDGLIDLVLGVAAALLISLSDREAFWGPPLKPKRRKGHSSVAQ